MALPETYMDSSPLLAQLRQVYKVPDKDCVRLIQLFEPLEVKKNEHLFQSGNIAKYVYFIDEGCLRQYYVNNNGEERTIYFKVEGGWVVPKIECYNSCTKGAFLCLHRLFTKIFV